MKSIANGVLLCLLLSCSSQKVSTVWRSEPVTATRYERILVVAILPEEDTVLRKTIEHGLAQPLQQIGYLAVSAIDEFGEHGLSEGSQESTYLRLCNNGIDAVLTVALLPTTEKELYGRPYSGMYPNQYYFQRIWSYRNMGLFREGEDQASFYVWESILFDLTELKAVCAIQSKQVKGSKLEITADRFINQLLASLQAQKILKAKESPPRPPQAFRELVDRSPAIDRSLETIN